MLLNQFKDLIRERSGLYFDDSRIVTLKNGISARMSERDIGSDYEYLNCLLQDRDELSRLLNLLTINETYFFRESCHLNLLAEKLIPEMLNDKKEGGIKILSAGCSTGEEPYSLLIALMEKYGPGIRPSVSIIGFDIDGNAVRTAREGIFTAYSFRDVPRQLMEKYFEPAGHDRHRIKDIIREGVNFKKFNLLDNELPEELKNADVIFYRNVSIYFDPETQKNIFKKLSELINENGYLFVGSTETISHNIGILSLIEMDGIFLFRKVKEGAAKKNGKQQAVGNIAKQNKSVIPAKAGIQKAKYLDSRLHGNDGIEISTKDDLTPSSFWKNSAGSKNSPFEEALSYAQAKKYDEALKSIEGLTEKDSAFIKAQMLKAGILINMNRLEDAKKICLKIIGMDRWCLEGQLLLGLISRMQNDEDKAVKRFKEAVFIRPSCWLAHFYLAEIYNSSGERKNAGREYEITIKQLSKGDFGGHGLTFFPLAFSNDNIAHLCKMNLNKLKGALT